MSTPDETDLAEAWRNLKLSLERPYKDDSGEPIRNVLDIEPDGTYIYEPKETADERLKSNLHRIFQERGHDFFDKPEKRVTQGALATDNEDESADGEGKDDEASEDEDDAKPMTFTELQAMRMELVPQLYIALGEITQARDILNSFLSTTQSKPRTEAPTPSLSGTVVSKLPPIPSLQAFNAQMVIGSKDEALRKAADLFNSVAGRMERTQTRSEQYWVNALNIRLNNWRMVPAPLPPGSTIGKGADRTAKDLLVLYGLEETPAKFRRKGMASLADIDGENRISFQRRQHMRMRVSLCFQSPDGSRRSLTNTIKPFTEDSVDATLSEAQLELIDEEIFSVLIQEGNHLSTALGRVSERLVVIDAAEGVELKFELLKDAPVSPEVELSPICDLIYHILHILLLRRHKLAKSDRLNATGNFPNPRLLQGWRQDPPLLAVIVEFLQYKVFCERLKSELDRAAKGLEAVGFGTEVAFDAIGETGEEMVQVLSDYKMKQFSGEAVLRIDNRTTLRLTFIAPSMLTAHLTQASLEVFSLPQLNKLLQTEIEGFVLQRISHLGEKLRGGTWFIDVNHLVARWDGCICTFQISFSTDMKINCSAFRVDSKTGRRGNQHQYSELSNVPLLSWVETLIQQTS
ncbi:subunit 17 of mediator complex-domain-containing protein [Coprinopsis sp. MPI-PUGE-AT-0042]|nr:subunit 17 of mediator complex-domain-containing protein [Coprinopsis sp. MPI-PUGE-AT-0042]